MHVQGLTNYSYLRQQCFPSFLQVYHTVLQALPLTSHALTKVEVSALKQKYKTNILN